MKLLFAFFRLVRWPNLLFIALTQLLFYYCIIIPSLPPAYYQLPYKLTQPLFFLLAGSSVLIAAAGYIINDYFDINIDLVNKPDKMVVEKIIKRRWAIVLHWSITTAGLILSLYVSFKTSFIVLAANVLCTILLWFYSTTFKKKLLSGNVIISMLTAWTVLVLYFATNNTYHFGVNFAPEILTAMNRIFKFAVLYSGFAFIISLVREVVKDIEDMEGDAKYNCKTMPVVWGVPPAKVFAGVWLVVLTGALTIIQFYAFQLGWWLSALYCLVLVILPIVWILFKLYTAQNTQQYHRLSSIIKLVMLSGILSMLFFKIYV
jgi:4-hydroxybenzoate polyprenyltransferase